MSKLFKNNYELIREGRAPRIVQEKNLGSFHRANEINGASQLNLDQPMTVRAILNLIRARNFEGFPACTFTDRDNVFEVRISISKIDQ
jgi:methionyl-tRNA formyltransferase